MSLATVGPTGLAPHEQLAIVTFALVFGAAVLAVNTWHIKRLDSETDD